MPSWREHRYLLSWLLFGVVAAAMLDVAWVTRNDPSRADGNNGHTTIDFGGQWLMGRMVVEGYGKHLYDRRYERLVLSEHYSQEETDNLLDWLMGDDEGDDDSQHVGGPLYPPVHCFVCYPLALLTPQIAYRCDQVLHLVEALLAGWAVARLSRGRVWLPIAALLVILFYGFSSSMLLGQNAALALALLLWGWVFMSEGHPLGGGFLWGLLAFKPVWVPPFILVTLLTRRWHAAVAMALTGLGLVMLTLPVVGWHSWLDWVQVGREATGTYASDAHWISISRDVLNLPRRWYPPIDSGSAAIIGWGLLAIIFATTTVIAVARRRATGAATGPLVAFIVLGMWLCSFHFMYYDLLLAAFPLAVLLVDDSTFRLTGWTSLASPRTLLPVCLIVLIYLEYLVNYLAERCFNAHAVVGTWDTPFLIIIWAWCGVISFLSPTHPRQFSNSASIS